MTGASAAAEIWLLLGRKEGDNAQLRAIARRLGRDFVEKSLEYRSHELLVGRLLGATLAGVDLDRSDAIEPPWPRLVLSAGRRNEPVARLIKVRSEGECRIVHLGRPWSHPERFDLVVTTPQYQVPPGPGVVEIDLPIHLFDLERGRARAAQLEAELAPLPRPWTAVLLGGNAGDFRLSGARVARLLDELQDLLDRIGGSLLVAGSARTPRPVLDRLELIFADRARVYHFGRDDPANPYAAYLLLADSFVITADSVSMAAEALATGKPLRIFDSRIGSRRVPWFLDPDGWRFRPLVQRLSRKLAPRRLRRDVMRIHRRLEAEGRIAWLGSGIEPKAPTPDDGSADLDLVVRRVLELLD